LNQSTFGSGPSVFFRIFLVFAVIVTLLVLARDRQWFERTGVLGHCAVIAGPAGDSGQWWSCQEGWLSGYPRLDGDGCTRDRRPPGREVWRCPAPLVTSPGAF
jgi:hypothetical protein